MRAYQIRPLQILTGGSPRLLVIVAGFARHRSLRQLMEELVTLIDEHTEYFRGHLEVLAKNERRVYVSVIDLWQPSKAGEIAARARMDIRVVSTMLGRLVDRGVVIVEGNGRKRLYVAAERLYCIYYKLRRERDEAAVVRKLIHFMAVFYSEAELFEMSGKLIAEAARSPAIRKGIEWAIAEMPQVDGSFSFMKQPRMERPSDQPSATDDEGAEKLLQKIVAAFETGAFEKTIEMVGQVIASQRANGSLVPPPLIARAFLMKAIAHKALGDSEAAIADFDEVNERFGASEAPEIRDLVARALFYKGVLQEQLGDSEAAIVAYDEVIKRLGTGEAPEVQVLAARALCLMGFMRVGLGDSEAAIGAFDELIERCSASNVPEIRALVAGALFNKGVRQTEICRAEEALHTCEELERRLGTLTGNEEIEFRWRARWVRTKALLVQEKTSAAMNAFRFAYTAFVPDHGTMMHEMIWIVLNLVVAGASVPELVEILSSDEAKSETLVPLVVALRQHAGETVRAPDEVLQVAEDIRKRIKARTTGR